MANDYFTSDVICRECGERVRLVEEQATGMMLTCDCPLSRVDVTDSVSDSNLLDPITGQWSTVDED